MRKTLALCTLLLVLLGTENLEAASPNSVGQTLQKNFVWTDAEVPRKTPYVMFRKKWSIGKLPQKATLHLFADSRYMLWINGQYVERGPCRFDPKAPQYDSMDITSYLQKGDNVVAILVHHFRAGRKSPTDPQLNGRMMLHRPGLTACLEFHDGLNHAMPQMSTDRSWRCRVDTRLMETSGRHIGNSWGSIPDNIDATKEEGDWSSLAYDDTAWQFAVPIPGASWGQLESRIEKGIPRLRETPVSPLRKIKTDPRGGRLLTEHLPLTLKKGEGFCVDLGRFALAYTDMQIESTRGSRVVFSYPQRYFSSGNRLTGSPFKSHYVTKGGSEQYISLDVVGMRYLQIYCDEGQVTFNSIKLIERLYPFDVIGQFTSNDKNLNAIWKIGMDTILCCSEDAYIDCIPRERAEWLGDSVLIAFPVTSVTTSGPAKDGNPTYGDARLFRNMLRHIAQSQQPDGRVKAHHPSNRWDIHGFIEDYACLWIQGVLMYYRQTGDMAFVREMLPAIERQLAWFQSKMTTRGLVRAREFLFFSNPLVYKTCEGTTLNCYLYRSLEDAATLEQLAGNSGKADDFRMKANSLKKAINQNLWDADSGSYYGGVLDGEMAAANSHAAVAALHFGVVPEERKALVHNFLVNHYAKENWWPFSARLLLETLFRLGESQKALDFIREKWTPMTLIETKSTWEQFTPTQCCHHSGASPTWLLSTFVLGVQPVKDLSDRQVYLKPQLGDLTSAKGTVVTPYGPVHVEWNLESPNQLRAKLALPDGIEATVDMTQFGGTIQKHVRSGQYNWPLSENLTRNVGY